MMCAWSTNYILQYLNSFFNILSMSYDTPSYFSLHELIVMQPHTWEGKLSKLFTLSIYLVHKYVPTINIFEQTHSLWLIILLSNFPEIFNRYLTKKYFVLIKITTRPCCWVVRIKKNKADKGSKRLNMLIFDPFKNIKITWAFVWIWYFLWKFSFFFLKWYNLM